MRLIAPRISLDIRAIMYSRHKDCLVLLPAKQRLSKLHLNDINSLGFSFYLR